jgi:CDP-diacylglycerol--glycerol-3-phosphate 3-phosphatidyltransferase
MATLSPTRPPVFTLPNQLTAARFVLALILFGLIAVEAWGWCLAVFAVAAITDWLDGYLARVRNEGSALGRNLDPLVDKVLLCGAFIFLLPHGYDRIQGGWLYPWMVAIVVIRELVITSLRSYVESLGAKFGADVLGKLKMVLQCAAVLAIFVTFKCREWYEPLTPACGWVRDGLIYAMLAATLASGLQYLWRAALLLKSCTIT